MGHGKEEKRKEKEKEKEKRKNGKKRKKRWMTLDRHIFIGEQTVRPKKQKRSGIYIARCGKRVPFPFCSIILFLVTSCPPINC
jgi:hypothetical protein